MLLRISFFIGAGDELDRARFVLSGSHQPYVCAVLECNRAGFSGYAGVTD